jgi:RNA polymerase sigma-70 factor (ECF subfamily)
MTATGDRHARTAAEAAARKSYGKLVAFLASRTRDVAAAEDALSEAFAAALVNWATFGTPGNPDAWLVTVARRKAIDASRRRAIGEGASSHLRILAEELATPTAETQEIPDERLRLLFACAHPAIEPAVRAPLMLQTILGFDAAAIASAFLIAPATMSQRLVRAKAKIKDAGIPFRIPERSEMRERLESVLEAIYAAYTEGWSDPTGTEVRRRDLAEEAIWLVRLVVSLLPDVPEALALLALMVYSEARRAARRNEQGDYVPLAEQDPANWDNALIDEAEALLKQAGRLAFSSRDDETRADGAHQIGRYQLEAAVQSAHVVRRRTGSADWAAINRLYDALWVMTDSPVVAINRAIAIAETQGPAAGRAAIQALAKDTRLAEYQPYWAARAELLARTGDIEAADEAFERSIGLESDPAVRRFLQRRRETLSGSKQHWTSSGWT